MALQLEVNSLTFETGSIETQNLVLNTKYSDNLTRKLFTVEHSVSVGLFFFFLRVCNSQTDRSHIEFYVPELWQIENVFTVS